MSIKNIKLTADNKFMVTFDGRDLPELEADLAISAPGIPNAAQKTAERISKDKFLVAIRK